MKINLEKKTLIHPHTPKPWIVTASSNPKNGTAWRDIVSMGSVFSPSYVGEACGQDAFLFAAAPDLLQVARDFVLLCELHDWEGAVLDAAKEAISKAEGLDQ